MSYVWIKKKTQNKWIYSTCKEEIIQIYIVFLFILQIQHDMSMSNVDKQSKKEI